MVKQKSLKGLGARYGIKIRKQYAKIHFQLKEKRTCPECGSQQFNRDAVENHIQGRFKVAGTAYDVQL